MCNVCSRRSNTINSTSTCVIEASQLYAFYFLVPVCDNCRLSALTRHFKQSIRCGPQIITITRTPPSGLIQRWAEFFGRIHIFAQNRISPNNSAHLWFNSALGRGQLLALTRDVTRTQWEQFLFLIVIFTAACTAQHVSYDRIISSACEQPGRSVQTKHRRIC